MSEQLLAKKYEKAMQTLFTSSDAIYTLSAQLDIANEEITKLKQQIEELQKEKGVENYGDTN